MHQCHYLHGAHILELVLNVIESPNVRILNLCPKTRIFLSAHLILSGFLRFVRSIQKMRVPTTSFLYSSKFNYLRDDLLQGEELHLGLNILEFIRFHLPVRFHKMEKYRTSIYIGKQLRPQ
jgi:hypothetical protein